MKRTGTASTEEGEVAAPASPAASMSKAEQSYALLRSQILDGTYGPGYRLVLAELARESGMSTIPLREALRRLQSDGLVEVVRNVGARVAVFDSAQVEHALQVLARLEGYATAIAAPLLGAEDVRQARAINARMAAALDDFDPPTFTARNRELHFALYRHCPDEHLRALLESEWTRLDHMRRSSFSYVPGRARRSVAEHEALLDLIADGAPAAEIERAACEHKIGTATALHAAHTGADER